MPAELRVSSVAVATSPRRLVLAKLSSFGITNSSIRQHDSAQASWLKVQLLLYPRNTLAQFVYDIVEMTDGILRGDQFEHAGVHKRAQGRRLSILPVYLA
jgi:hypothetical protein